MKTYKAPQQVKYLHLQAEVDILLQQLQALSKQPANTDYANIQPKR
jgi:hypothetical protein